MNCNVIQSSSKGNCFLYYDNTVMVDVGVPFEKIKTYIDNIKIIFITHQHSDHINPTTIRKLIVKKPTLKFVCGEFIVKRLINIGVQNIDTLKAGVVYDYDFFKVSPITLYHDCLCFGFRFLEKMTGHKHIHATDTAHLDGITATNYSSASLECNHEENRVLELIAEAEAKGEFTYLKGAMNSHLSVQQAVEFVKKNNIKKLIPCHISKKTEKEVKEYINENLY